MVNNPFKFVGPNLSASGSLLCGSVGRPSAGYRVGYIPGYRSAGGTIGRAIAATPKATPPAGGCFNLVPGASLYSLRALTPFGNATAARFAVALLCGIARGYTGPYAAARAFRRAGLTPKTGAGLIGPTLCGLTYLVVNPALFGPLPARVNVSMLSSTLVGALAVLGVTPAAIGSYNFGSYTAGRGPNTVGGATANLTRAAARAYVALYGTK